MAPSNSRKTAFFKLDLLVLAVLNRKDCYGYEITSTISLYTNHLLNAKEGVLYPILYRLSSEGYISSESRVVNGRNRVYYHLEDAGREHLETLVREWMLGESLINSFLATTGAFKESHKELLTSQFEDLFRPGGPTILDRLNALDEGTDALLDEKAEDRTESTSSKTRTCRLDALASLDEGKEEN